MVADSVWRYVVVLISFFWRVLNKSSIYLDFRRSIVFSMVRFITSKTQLGLEHILEISCAEARKEFVKCITSGETVSFSTPST